MIWELNLEWWAAIADQCLLSVLDREVDFLSILYKFTKRRIRDPNPWDFVVWDFSSFWEIFDSKKSDREILILVSLYKW